MPVILPLMPRRPIESGFGSPALPLCAFLRARTSAVLRGSGISSRLISFSILKSFPARMGAKCTSVSLLQAIGLVESLLANMWLICGSVHPPLFASISVFLIAIASIYFAKYRPFFNISSFRSGIKSHKQAGDLLRLVPSQ